MERFPDPHFNEFRGLLDQSDRLIRRSEDARVRSNQLTRHLADLNADSNLLIEHCKRLGERFPGGGREKADQG
jgi:hypothetical protein